MEQRDRALGTAKLGSGTGTCGEQRGARKTGCRGMRKEKGGAGSEPGGAQACGEKFRIAASLRPAPPGHSPTVWAWNLSRHPEMQRGDAGGHRTAGGDPQPKGSSLRTMLPPGTPSTHPNCARKGGETRSNRRSRAKAFWRLSRSLWLETRRIRRLLPARLPSLPGFLPPGLTAIPAASPPLREHPESWGRKTGPPARGQAWGVESSP